MVFIRNDGAVRQVDVIKDYDDEDAIISLNVSEEDKPVEGDFLRQAMEIDQDGKTPFAKFSSPKFRQCNVNSTVYYLGHKTYIFTVSYQPYGEFIFFK